MQLEPGWKSARSKMRDRRLQYCQFAKTLRRQNRQSKKSCRSLKRVVRQRQIHLTFYLGARVHFLA